MFRGGDIMISAFFRLLWNGTVKMSAKNKYVVVLYIGLFIMMIISWIIFNNILIMFIIIFITAIILGIRYYVTEILPIKQMRAFFYEVFKEIKFETDYRIPYFLSMHFVSEYITAFSFRTYFPLKMWFAKKDHLEMYMNDKIIDIKQDENDKRIVNLLIERKPLPEKVKWQDQFINNDNVLNVGIGHYGIIGMNLEKYPHSFIAGETGSGKSNILKCLIHQALIKGYDVILIDFKRGVSFSEFSDKVAVYYDYKSVITVLKDMVNETTKRLDKFRDTGVDNINDYNRTTKDYLDRKIVFIDELAELLKTRDKETANILNDSIETLTRLSRAVGIHLIMGIQRPDSTIISGQIKNNVSYRICGRFVDKEPSRIMLGSEEASTLSNIKGRFIIKDDNFYEVQSFYFNGSGNILQTVKVEEKTVSVKNHNVVTQPVKEEPKEISPFEFDFSDFKE